MFNLHSVLIYFLIVIIPLCWAVHEDARCKCICLDQSGLLNGSKPMKKVYVKAIETEKCTCPYMLGNEKTNCPYCTCKYQVRNTTTIKVVVCLIITIISALILYMLFLQLLESVLSARKMGHLNLNDLSARSDGSANASQLDTTAQSSGSSGLSLPRSLRPSTANRSGDTLGPTVVWSKPRPGAEHLIDAELSAKNESPTRGRLRLRPPKSSAGVPGVSSNKQAMILNPQDSQLFSPIRFTPNSNHPGVSNVVNRVRDQQQRWKGDVEAQRARVFSERSLLN